MLSPTSYPTLVAAAYIKNIIKVETTKAKNLESLVLLDGAFGAQKAQKRGFLDVQNSTSPPFFPNVK